MGVFKDARQQKQLTDPSITQQAAEQTRNQEIIGGGSFGEGDAGLYPSLDLAQTTLQPNSTNWWNQFRNTIDEINKGPDQYKVMEIQNQLDYLASSPDFSSDPIKQEKYKSLTDSLNSTINELAAQDKDIQRRDIDLDWKLQHYKLLAEERSSMLDWFSSESATDLGGTFSQTTSMLGSMAAPIVSQAAIGGPVGLFTGAATSLYLLYDMREKETASEVSDAYQEKIANDLKEFQMLNDRMPDENEMRKIRMNAFAGVEDVRKKNMTLMAGDVAEVTLALVPWLNWTKSLTSGLRATRAGRNTLRLLSLSSAVGAEGLEEGLQFKYKNDYMKGKYMTDKSYAGAFSSYFDDREVVARAMMGSGDPDLYTSEEFRNSVRSGMIGGMLFGAPGSFASLVKDHVDFNRTKAVLSKQAAANQARAFGRYQADTLYKLFSQEKENFVYNVLDVFGKSGDYDYTPETAAAEIERLKNLKGLYDKLNDKYKSPTGWMYSKYMEKAKGDELKVTDHIKRDAFSSAIQLEIEKDILSDLESLRDEKGSEDYYGYIPDDSAEVKKRVEENAKRLGLDPEFQAKMGTDRVDVQLSSQQARIERHQRNIREALDGSILQKATRLFEAAKRSKDGHVGLLEAFKYISNEKAYIKEAKERDDLKTALNASKNISLLKRLESGEDPLSIMKDINLAQVVPDSRVLEKLSSAARGKLTTEELTLQQQLSELEKAGEELEPGSIAFDENLEASQPIRDRLQEIAEAKENIDALVNESAAAEEVEANKEDKSDLDYKQEFAESHFKSIEEIEALLESPENTPLDEAEQAMALMQRLKAAHEADSTIFDPRLAETGFNYPAKIKHSIERLKAFLAEIERRLNDRDLKNAGIYRQAVKDAYTAAGIKVTIGENNEITFDIFNENLLAKTSIDDILAAAKKEYKETGVLNSLYPELIISRIKIQAKDAVLAEISKQQKDIQERISSVSAGFVKYKTEYNEAELDLIKEFSHNPPKVIDSIIQLFVRSTDPEYDTVKLLKDKFKTDRDIEYFINNLPTNSTFYNAFLDAYNTYKTLRGLYDLQTSLNSSFNFVEQLAKENAEVKNGLAVAPSPQQHLALHNVLRWFLAPIKVGERYAEFAFLSGYAGTGKTFLAGMVKKFVGLANDEIYIAAHSKEAADNLAKSTGISRADAKYSNADPYAGLIDNLNTDAASIKNLKLIVFDEAGFLNETRMRALGDAVSAYNKRNNKAVKVFLLGDAYQMQEPGVISALSTNLGEETNIRYFNPLSIVYRTGVSTIVQSANAYYQNKETVTKLGSKVNSDHTFGVLASASPDIIFQELKRKKDLGQLTDGRRRIVIVSPDLVEAFKTRLAEFNVEVMSIYEAQGQTTDEVFVYLSKSKEFADPKVYNTAMYTAITRAKYYAVVADNKIAEESPAIRDDFKDTSSKEKQEFNKNKLSYKEKLAKDLESAKALGVAPAPVAVSPVGHTSTSEAVNEEEIIEEQEPEEKSYADDRQIFDEASLPITVVPTAGELRLMFPQAFTRKDGKYPIKPGDEVHFILAKDDAINNGAPHIRVVKSLGGRNYALVGVIGSFGPNNELAQLQSTNPVLHGMLVEALNGQKIPTVVRPGETRDVFSTGLNSIVEPIFTAKIKHHNPLKVLFGKFGQSTKSVDKALKDKIAEDVRKKLLKNGQEVTDITVSAVVYTSPNNKDRLGVSVATLPDHQNWVKAGRPYLKVTATLKTGGTFQFNIPCRPKLLDVNNPKHKDWLKPLNDFYVALGTITTLQEKALGDRAPNPYSSAASVITKEGKNGTISLTQNEVFLKLLRIYPGSPDLIRLASKKKQAERALETEIESKLTPEEYAQLTEARKLAHNLMGIYDKKSFIDQSSLVESDFNIQEVPVSEYPKTATTNIEVIGKDENTGFVIFKGRDANVAVKYYKYLGHYFKIKAPVVEENGKFVVRGKMEASILQDINDQTDTKKKRVVKTGVLYEEQNFDNVDDLLNDIDSAAQFGMPKLQENTGAAQARFNVLVKNNAALRIKKEDGEWMWLPISRMIDKDGVLKREALPIIPKLNTENQGMAAKVLDKNYEIQDSVIEAENIESYYRAVIGAILNDPSGSNLRFPLKLRKQDSSGDFIDAENVETEYEDVEPSQIVLEGLPGTKVDGAESAKPALPVSNVDTKNAKQTTLEGAKPIASVSGIDAKKADIEIGKVGNTEYEVKSDGVYYKDKKLDNPENKTHRQLIEADIERRRQEELNNIKSKAEIEKYFANKFKNEFPNGVNESGIISIQEVLEKLLNEDEHKLIEQYRYSNILKDKINAKYDAELEALEGDVTKNVGFENDVKTVFENSFIHGTDDGYRVKKEGTSYEDATDIRVEVAKRTNGELGKIVEFKTTDKNGLPVYHVAVSVYDTKRGAGNGFVAYSFKNRNNIQLADKDIYDVLRQNLNAVFEQGLVDKIGRISKTVSLKDINKPPQPQFKAPTTKADIERRRQEELKSLPLAEKRDEINNANVMEVIPGDKFGNVRPKYIPFIIIEEANKNDKLGGQTAREINIRGGYSTKELDSKFPNWRNYLTGAKEINAKYDAEYIDKVKKGEFTKQQAKDALKEIGRLTTELEKQIDDINKPAQAVPPEASSAPKTDSSIKQGNPRKRNRKNRPGDDGGRALLTKREVLLGREITRGEALNIIKQFIPNINAKHVKFVSELEMLSVTGGESAWGYFKDGVIYLLEGDNNTVYENVVRHEAFHKIFWLGFTPQERKFYYNLVENVNKSLVGATRQEKEEYMAEKFQEWRRGTKSDHPLLSLFKRILELLGFVRNNQRQLEKLFEAIESGKYKVNYDSRAPSRAIIDVQKRFGSVSNYLACQKTLLAYLNDKEYWYKNSDGTIKLAEDAQDLPHSKSEAIQSFKLYATSVIQDADSGNKLTAEEELELPYLRILLSREDNIAIIVNSYYKAEVEKVETAESVREEIDELFDELSDEERVNLTNEIITAEYINWEEKTTARVKDFLNSIYVNGRPMRSKFGYAVLLRALSNIELSSDNVWNQIVAGFKKQKLGNIYIRALYEELSDLKDLALIDSYNTLVNGKVKTLPLPNDASFVSTDEFVINGYGSIKRGSVTPGVTNKREGNIEFLERALAFAEEAYTAGVLANSIDLNAINVMFRSTRAKNTLVEILSHFGSMREKEPYAAKIKVAYVDNGATTTRTVKYLYFEPESATFKTSSKKDIEDAIRTAYNTDIESLVNLSKRLKDALKKDLRTQFSALKEFYVFVGTSAEKISANLLEDRNTIEEALLDADGLLNDVLHRVKEGNIDTLLDEKERGRLENLANLISSNDITTSATNYIDQKNRKRYNFITYSSGIKYIKQFLTYFKNKENKKLFNLPEYAVIERMLKYNFFAAGKNTIHAVKDFDAHKYENANKAVEYKGESPKDSVNRRFRINFVRDLINQKAAKTLTYLQAVHPISNKPGTFSVRVDLKSYEELKEAVQMALDGQKYRPEYVKWLKSQGIDVKNIGKAANINYFLYDSVEALQEVANKSFESFYKQFITEQRTNKKGEIVTQSIEDSDIIALYENLLERGLVTSTKDYTEAVKEVYKLFYVNNYINTHFLTELYAGDRGFYKPNRWDDLIKRLQSVFGMGKSPVSATVEGKTIGSKKEYKLLVAKDQKLIINELTDYTDTLQKLYKGNPEEGYDSTDGQMYVLPSFMTELENGYGNTDGVGPIMKPLHYEIDKYGVPRLIKVSITVITDDLAAKFPELNRIREAIIANNTDGLVFESGMKVGAPNILFDINESDSDGAASTITLQTSSLRIQQNPIAKLDAQVSNFSQLLYMLNVNLQNGKITKNVYLAQQELILEGLNKLIDDLSDESGISQDKLRRQVKQTLVSDKHIVTPGSERIYELLDHKTEGKPTISLSNPSIVNKVITQISSIVGSNTVKSSYPGSKLVLSSSAPVKVYNLGNGITTYDKLDATTKQLADKFYTLTSEERTFAIKALEARDADAIDKFRKELERSTIDGFLAAKLLDFAKSDSIIYEGALVPKRLKVQVDPKTGDNFAEAVLPLTKALEISQKLGISLDDLRNTVIAVRIPTTGIHSAIPIKIVAFIDSGVNLAFVPEEIVPLHGSDFDVDSIFVIRREFFNEKEVKGFNVKEVKVSKKGRLLTDRERKIVNIMFSRYQMKAKQGQTEKDLKAIFASKNGYFYNKDTDQFEYKTTNSNKVVLLPFRNITTEEQDAYAALFEKEKTVRLQKFAEQYDEKLHLKEFANTNHLFYDDTSGSFTKIAKEVATVGEPIGYLEQELDENYVNDLEREYQFISKDEGISESDKKKTKELIQKSKIKYYRNVVLQGYSDILTDPKNRPDMLTPISMEVFRNDIFRDLVILLGLKDQSDLLDNLDLNDFENQVKSQMINMAGVSQVGVVANTMKVIAYHVIAANEAGVEPLINYGKEEPFTINGFPVSKLQGKELPILGKEPGTSWESLDTLINAAIDNVKEQILSIINLTDVTGNAFAVLVGSGVPLKTVTFLMNQPIMKELSYINNRHERQTKRNELVAKLNARLEKAGITDFWKSKEIRTHLTQEGLATGVSLKNLDNVENVEDVKTQLAALKLFEKFSTVAEGLFETTSALGALIKLPSTYSGAVEALESIQNTNSENYVIKNSSLLASDRSEGLPHINALRDVLVNLRAIYRAAIVQHNAQFEDFILTKIKETGIKLDYLDPYKNLDLVKQEYFRYFISSFDDFKTSPKEKFEYTGRGEDRALYGSEAWLQNFASKVRKYKKENASDNLFLQSLNFEPIYKDSGLVQLTFTAGTSLSEEDKLLIAEDFKKLPEELKRGFLKYAVLAQGMSFGVFKYSAFIDPVVQKELNDYIENKIFYYAQDQQILENSFQDFYRQLALNHPEMLPSYNGTFVKEVTIEEGEQVEIESPISATTASDDLRAKGIDLVVHKTGVALPHPIIRFGTFKRSDIYIRIAAEEIKGEKGGNTITAYYTKLGSETTSRYSNFVSNIYTVEEEDLKTNRSELNFKPGILVKVANPATGAAPINGKNSFKVSNTSEVVVDENDQSVFPSAVKPEIGSVIYLRDVSDPLRKNIHRYTVTKAKTKEKYTEYELTASEASFFNETREDRQQTARSIAHNAEAAKVKELKSSAVLASIPNTGNTLLDDSLGVLRSLGAIGNVPIVVVPDSMWQSDLKPFYYNNKIYVNESLYNNIDSRFNVHILVHELTHAYLNAALEADESTLPKDIALAVKQLKEAYNKLKGNRTDYGFSDIKEFVAELNSNAAFVESLKSTSAWSNILRFLANILNFVLSKLGIKKVEVDTVNRLRTTITNIILANKDNSIIDASKNVSFFNNGIGDWVAEQRITYEVDDTNNVYKNLKKNVSLKRVTDFIRKFSPFNSTESDPTSIATAAFEARNLDKAKDKYTLITGKNSKEELTFDEYVAHLTRKSNTDKAKGKIVHKLLQLQTEGNTALLKEVEQLAAEKPDQDAINVEMYSNWLFKNDTWKTIMNRMGVSIGYVSGALLKREKLYSEVPLANEEIDLAGTADLIIEHEPNELSIVDFKSGFGLTREPRFMKLMKFAENHGEMEWTNINKAKLQLMLYAVLIKSQKPEVKFRNIQIAHLQPGSTSEWFYSVEFDSFLGIISDYFRANNPDWWSANKELFRPSAYGGSLAEVKQDVKNNNQTLEGQQKVYLKRQNEIISILNRRNIGAAKRAELNEELQDLTKRILQLEYPDTRITDHKKDIGVWRRLTSNLYNIGDPLVRAFGRYLFKQKNDARLRMDELRGLHEKFLKPVLKEYYSNIGAKSIINSVTFGAINSLNYSAAYGFLYDRSDNGIKFVTDTKGMTEAQKQYSEFIRTIPRYEFYLTADPDEVLKMAENDLKKDLPKDLKKYIESAVSLAKELPKENKMLEFDQLKNRDFAFTEDFVPLIASDMEEKAEKYGVFSKEFWSEYRDRKMENYFEEGLNSVELKGRMPFKYLFHGIGQEGDFTINPSIIFERSVANSVWKRHLDDVYVVGKGLHEYFESRPNDKNMENMSKFVWEQTLLHTHNPKLPTKFLNKELYVFGKKVNLDKILRNMRAYSSFLVLGLKWKAGLANGVMETLFNYKEGLAGSIQRLFGLKVDFTLSDLNKANTIWFKYQADKMAGNKTENKLFHLLRKFDYQTDNYIYPIDKNEMIGVKNPLLQTSTLFLAHSIPEQYTNALVLIAQMLHDGTWDKYDNKGEWIGGIRGVDEKGNKVYGYTSEEITKLKKVSERIHGSYRQDERSALELYTIGQWLIQFKRFFPNLLHTAFASEHTSDALGRWIETGGKLTVKDDKGMDIEVPVFKWEAEIDEGRLRVFVKYAAATMRLNKLFFKQGKNGPELNYKWDQLSEAKKKAVINVYTQAAMMFSLFFAVSAIFKDTSDDDEWKRRFGRIPFDMAQGWNLLDLLRAGVNPTVVLPRLYKFSEGSYEYFIESGLGGERIEYGEHAGEFKGKSKIRSGLPWVTQYENMFGSLGEDKDRLK